MDRLFSGLIIVSALLLCSLSVFGQAVFHDCPMGGDKQSLAGFDSLKNRYYIPRNFTPFDFTKVAAMKYDDNTSQKQAVKLKGYVITVKYGGTETCNCHTKIKDDMDVHIVLSNSENDLDEKDGIVARQTTPRIRAELNNGWDEATVKKLFYHKWVTVSGYLFDDKEHKAMSAADGANPDNTHRATCWEIHPVTNIEITGN